MTILPKPEDLINNEEFTIGVFSSQARRELADEFNKANFGNPCEILHFNAKGDVSGVNDMAVAYVVVNVLGRRKYIFNADTKAWIKENNGVFHDVDESDIKNNIKTLIVDVVKLSEGDGDEGKAVATKYVKNAFFKHVFEVVKDEMTACTKEQVPEGFVIINEKAFDVKKEEFLDEVPKKWLARPNIPVEPGETSEGEFTKWIETMCQQDGALSLKKYLGSILLGGNQSKKFLILEGESDSGKSQITKILEYMMRGRIGNLRPKTLGSRFEVGRVFDKPIITTPDIGPDQLDEDGASTLKSLVSQGDFMDVEYKNSNKVERIEGVKHVILTCEFPINFPQTHSPDGYVNRIIRIPCKIAYTKKNNNFVKELLNKEGEKIVKWLIEGAQLYLKEVEIFGSFQLSSDQVALAKELCDVGDVNTNTQLKDIFSLDKDGELTAADVREHITNNNIASSAKVYNQILKAQFNVMCKPYKKDGKTVRLYKGITIKK